MAHCNLCNKNTRCSCKGGGCPSCNSTNKQIAIMNDLIKFGLSKDIIRNDLHKIHTYVDKIDTYTLYEYYTNQISEEEFNKALEDFRPVKKKNPTIIKKSEVVDTSGRVNPEKQCVFKGPGAWERCIYCNSIRKYIQGQQCPRFKENIGSTDTENEISDV